MILIHVKPTLKLSILYCLRASLSLAYVTAKVLKFGSSFWILLFVSKARVSKVSGKQRIPQTFSLYWSPYLISNFATCYCFGLILARCQAHTKATYSLPSAAGQRREHNKEFMSWDNDQERSLMRSPMPSWTNQAQIRDSNWINSNNKIRAR